MHVHITVNKELRRDEEAMSRMLNQIVSTSGMTGVNKDRFSRFCVLSGDIEPDKIAALEQLANVVAVEPDEKRYLS